MALIKCPECGKEISDTAKVCMNCGFTIQKWLKQQAAKETAEQKTAKKEQLDSTSLPGKSRKKMFIISGIAALVVLVTVLVVTVVIPGISKNSALKGIIAPTYGLKFGMSKNEVISTMEKAGCPLRSEYEHDSYYFLGFDSERQKIMDIDFSCNVYVILDKQSRWFGIRFVSGYPTQEERTEVHERILKAIKEKLGEPKKIDGSDLWETDEAIYTLGDADGIFSFMYIAGVSSYEEWQKIMISNVVHVQ